MSSLFARFGNLETKAASSENVIISLDNLQKTYLLGVEGVPALRGVSLDIKRGEFVIIYGTSGGGKTSLLNIIGTIDKPTKGHLTICGTRITSKTSDSELALIRLKKMGFVFQTFNLLSTLTALENVEMPMVLEGSLSGTERTNRATDLLERVSMGKRLDHLPSMLSGGEQQRVTIARAIANSPEILLLDEPTGDLDTTNTAIVMDMLATLNQDDNITMVMVTHDPALKNFAHRVIYMRDGKIQRIEVIDEKERALAIQDMKARSGTQSTNNTTKEIVRTLTEVKRPKDYITANDDSEKLAYGLVTELLQIEGNTSIDINSTSSDLVNTNNTLPQNRIALEKELQDINQGAEFSLFTSNTYSSSRTSSNASDYKVDV